MTCSHVSHWVVIFVGIVLLCTPIIVHAESLALRLHREKPPAPRVVLSDNHAAHLSYYSLPYYPHLLKKRYPHEYRALKNKINPRFSDNKDDDPAQQYKGKEFLSGKDACACNYPLYLD